MKFKTDYRFDPHCQSPTLQRDAHRMGKIGLKCAPCLAPVEPSGDCSVYQRVAHSDVVYCKSTFFHSLDSSIDPDIVYELHYGYSRGIIGGLYHGDVWGADVYMFGSDTGVAIFMDLNHVASGCPGYIVGLSSLTCVSTDRNPYLAKSKYCPRVVAWNGGGVCASISANFDGVSYSAGTAFPVRSLFWW